MVDVKNLTDEELLQRMPKKRNKWTFLSYGCLAIACLPILGFLIFNGVPVVISFIAMFTNMENNDLTTMTWNNFENFKLVFTDPRFYHAIGITLFLATSQFVTLLIALIISVLLEQKVKGAKIMQVLFFVPYICSSVAIAIMWQWVFSRDMGILNAILGQKINWLNDSEVPFRLTLAVYITIVWAAPAYGIVMFKAALKNVNPSLYEAASLDGAGGFSKFWHITLPSIKSVTLFLTLASITVGLSIFDQVKILAPISWTGTAGPEDMGLTLNYYIYLTGIQNGEMEHAAVMTWFLFFFTFAATFFVIRERNKSSEQ